MALTPEKREVLTLARERIALRKNGFICFALEDIARERPDLVDDCMCLHDYIVQQLSVGRLGALQTWQEKNGFGDRGDDQRRADRLAWIDWMLDEPKEA